MGEPDTVQDLQSDSDSSDSWSLVDENSPKIDSTSHEIAADNKEYPDEKRSKEEGEDDNDTDGVLVISDDDDTVTSTSKEDTPQRVDPQQVPTVTSSFEYAIENIYANAEKYDMDISSSATFRDNEDELIDDFYITNEKIKSYVHKRNNKISSLLNIILMGTLATAGTLAVGFMWGINDTCSMDVLDSVNGILVNLQKLQQENDLLKSKIRILQAMKYNKPIASDLDVEHFIQYEMQHDNNNKMPASYLDKNDGNIQQLEIIMDSLSGIKNSKFNYEMKNKPLDIDKMDSSLTIKPTSKTEKDEESQKVENSYKNQSLNQGDIEIPVENDNENIPKVLNADKKYKQRSKRDTKKYNIDSKPEINQASRIYCNDIEGEMEKNECLNLHNNDKYTPDKDFKRNHDKSYTPDKDSKQNKKNYDRSTKKNSKPYKKFRKGEESQKFVDENNKHLNNNINEDWYNKLYDSRKEMREKGIDEYDMLDLRNKAKWYFRRMKDRAKSRENFQGKIPISKKFLRREYFKSKF